MATLAETFELLKQAEFESKLAALQEAWGEDEVRISLLDEALDMIKQAQTDGTLPVMDAAQILDLGVTMVEESLEEPATEAAKPTEAAKKDTEKVAEEEVEKKASQEELDEIYAIGDGVGEILAEMGLDLEDIEKLASDEEAEELGRFCAQEFLKRQEQAAE